MEIREIIRMLKPLRTRMHLNNGLICFIACLCAGSIAAMVLAYISLWVPVPFLIRRIGEIYAGFAVLGILISLFLVPRTRSVIDTADGLGLKERLITAWQLRKEDSIVALLQRQDTMKAVAGTDFIKLYPLRFPLKLVIVLAASLVLTSVTFVLPSYAREDSKKAEKLQTVVEQQLEEIKKVQEELRNNENLRETDLKKILEEAERLAEELKKARTEEEAMKAVSRAENELEKLDLQKQLSKLGKALSSHDMTSGLGEAVQNKNAEDIKQALEQLMQQMEQKEVSPEEIAESLRQAAEQMDQQELAEQLTEAAEALEASETEGRKEALENLGNELSEMVQSQQNSGASQAAGLLAQALEQAKSNISKVDSSLSSGQNTSGASGQSSGQGSGLQAAQGGSEGGGEGSKSGQAAGAASEKTGNTGETSGKGQGQGKSSGQGQGSGLGQAPGSGQGGGGGAGEGSTNKDSGYTGSEQGGGGRKAGEGKEETFEQLYDPDHLGGDADPSYVSGEKQDGGQSSYSDTEQIPVEKGAMLPYHEVLGRYSGQAASYMEKTEIPAAMKDIVRAYFESLE